MTHDELLAEHERLIDLRFTRGHLTGAEKRRLRRLRKKIDHLEGGAEKTTWVWSLPTTISFFRRPPPDVPVTTAGSTIGETDRVLFGLYLDGGNGGKGAAVEARTQDELVPAFVKAADVLCQEFLGEHLSDVVRRRMPR